MANQTEYGLRSAKSDTDELSPIFRLIDGIINLGLILRASDVHIMPLSTKARLRYRIDGALFMPEINITTSVLNQMVARIKVLAHIKTAAVGTALDGHIAHNFNGRQIDIRVAIMPVKFGESVVLRIMNAERSLKTIEELGFSAQLQETLKEIVHRPSGMLIVSGPMNSGKTTSLYAVLQEINSPTKNIMTIEDPVEGVIEGINQIAVNEEANLDFAKGLRAILRMDVNAIMVGEIRDEETARIAIRAALTGHLLLTTLHANDSVSALFRLREMGAPPYLIAATLSGIISQRLVRKICPKCKEEYIINSNSAKYFYNERKIRVGDVFYRGRGCDFCHNSGYYGRTPIHEILLPNEELRNEILELARIDEVRNIAKKAGFKTMLDDALDKAKAGITTLDEIGRTLYGD